MAIDATMHLTRPGKRDAFMDWVQMLSGASLVLFMWCHMLLVSSVLLSPKLMDAIAWFFEEAMFNMVLLGGPIIFILFLIHFVLAARKMPFTANDQKTIWGHARLLKHRDTWLWLVQACTAIVVLVMGGIHMWVVLNDLPISVAKSAARVADGGWTVFYLVLLPFVELHVSIGFYRILVKWGFITTENRVKAKKAEFIMFAAFMVIGLLTIIRFVTLA
jgi:fumarate reductase subunit C